MNRQFDDVMLGSIELFCLAAEHGSFTAAATTASVTPAAVTTRNSSEKTRANHFREAGSSSTNRMAPAVARVAVEGMG